jgi:hypothetical protein
MQETNTMRKAVMPIGQGSQRGLEGLVNGSLVTEGTGTTRVDMRIEVYDFQFAAPGPTKMDFTVSSRRPFE